MELERLACARLPLAVALLLAFLGGALPIEAYYYPAHVRGYLLILGVEAVLSLLAVVCARWLRDRARLVATVPLFIGDDNTVHIVKTLDFNY